MAPAVWWAERDCSLLQGVRGAALGNIFRQATWTFCGSACAKLGKLQGTRPLVLASCGSGAAKNGNSSQKWKLDRQIRPVGVSLPNSAKTAAKNGNAARAKLGNYRGLQEAAGSGLWERRCQIWKLQPKMETRPPGPACGSAAAKLGNSAAGTGLLSGAAKNGNCSQEWKLGHGGMYAPTLTNNHG